MRNPVDELNRAMPAAAHVKLGDTLKDIIQSLNGINAAPAALVTYIDNLADMIDTLATRLDTTNAAVKALGTKLDADAGVTDTNYAAAVTGALATNIQAGLNADEVDAAGAVTLNAVTPIKTLSERAAEIGG